MATSPAFVSSFLNIPNSKISNHDVGFPKIRKSQSLIHLNPTYSISIVDTSPSSSSSCNSTVVCNSLTLDQGSINDEELKKAESKLGLKVRVKVPLKVYHVPKVPELELMGKVGVLKQYVGVYKGKMISANLPYKAEFVTEDALGRNGKPLKFVAHLREDEFEILD